jgi:hypothetical protein
MLCFVLLQWNEDHVLSFLRFIIFTYKFIVSVSILCNETVNVLSIECLLILVICLCKFESMDRNSNLLDIGCQFYWQISQSPSNSLL